MICFSTTYLFNLQKLNLIIGLTFICTFANAQHYKNDEHVIAKADEYFNKENYSTAIELYHDILKDDSLNTHAMFQVAEAKRKLRNYEEAEQWYEKVHKYKPKEQPTALYYVALMQKTNGKYLNALANFEQFIKNVEANPEKFKKRDNLGSQAKIEKRGCYLALEQKPALGIAKSFKIETQPLNTEYNDYAPVIYQNDNSLIITSGRVTKNNKTIDPILKEATSDNYRFIKVSDLTIWKELPDVDGFSNINTKYGDGAGVLNKNNTKFYFTSCQNPDGSCSIYLSELKKGKWQKPRPLNENINKSGFDSKQPCLNDQENTLFFVSNRKGGVGANDIWYATQKDSSDSWSVAKNLTTANTPLNENSPFYYPLDTVLFFASEGHESLGGLDVMLLNGVFTSKEKVVNLGAPFNSSADDCYFTIGEQKGYLSSNRAGGIGKFDIYSFNYTGDVEIAKELTLKPNEQQAPTTRYFDSPKSDSTSKSDYENINIGVINKRDNPNSTKIDIKGSIKDANSPQKPVTVKLVDQKNKINKVATSDNNGDFRMDQVENNNYVLQAEAKLNKTTGRTNIKLQSLTTYPVNKNNVSSEFENIFFDFGKSELRPEAKQSIVTLADFLKNNTQAQVEIMACTDTIGADEFNIKLSKLRGETVYNCLVENGVDRKSLIIHALGEATEGTFNDPKLYTQFNRRVLLNINNLKKHYQPAYVTCLVNPGTTFYSLSKEFNMSIDEIFEVNGLTNDNLFAFKPLRVKYTPNIKTSSLVIYLGE